MIISSKSLCLAVLSAFVVPGFKTGISQSPAPGFPEDGIMPTAETRADAFLSAHPDSDGRGVIVAIFDTGIDPGAEGLLTTSAGKVKIVDCVDATGSGDVDTSREVKIENHEFTGLTGRKIQWNPEWPNPSGTCHIGMKAGFELFPGELVTRLKRERKKKWNHRQITRRASVQERLTKARRESDPDNDTISELEKQIEQLDQLNKDWSDPGPIYDCAVYHDGKTWRAVVDTDEDGDLSDETSLTNYRDEPKFATFKDKSELNFSVNIYKEGSVLSIVTPSGDHGTHVAGIVSGNYDNQPELNGVAPGAQIVSVKIGDSRLGGMETGSAVIRGLGAVLRNKCQLVNMSYGEGSLTPNQGRVIDLISETVREHNVVFVASAGNEGPALSTVGAPGGTTSAVIGVGAYVSPTMIAAEYPVPGELQGAHFTWSSRGPARDGDLGVDITAPGAAFSPVPRYTLQRSHQMNGTSMSSPNACGCIALLISNLLGEKREYQAHHIKRAITASAKPLPDAAPFAAGAGMLDVMDAHQWLEQYLDSADPEISISTREGRGIYLREPHESTAPSSHRFSVKPLFKKTTKTSDQIKFERRYQLTPSTPWIQSPGYLMLTNATRPLVVRVNPTDLNPGVHFGRVDAVDLRQPEAGPAFSIPVTVVKPTPTEASTPWEKEFTVGPGEIRRQFFSVPQGTSSVTLKLDAPNTHPARRIVSYFHQFTPGKRFEFTSRETYHSLDDNNSANTSFTATGPGTFELCLAQFWSSAGSTRLKASLEIEGLHFSPSAIGTMTNGEPVAVTASALTKTDTSVSGQLTHCERLIQPTISRLDVLDKTRDLLPDNRVPYQLVLDYTFQQKADGDIRPRLAGLNHRLYENDIQSQLYMIFDSNKRRVTANDGWEPDPVHLKKGDYVVRYHLRHDDPGVLEKLREIPLRLTLSLKNKLTLSTFPDPESAALDRNADNRLDALPGERLALFIRPPDHSNLPDWVAAGDVLRGTFGTADHKIPVTCAVSVPKKSPSPETSPDDALKAALDRAVDLLAHAYGEDKKDDFDTLAAEILKARPDDLTVMMHQMKRFDEDPEERKRYAEEIVGAADDLIAALNEEELALELSGHRDTPENMPAASKRKDMLCDTLYRKARAIAYRDGELEKAGKSFEDTPFEEAYKHLDRWVDLDDEKYVLVKIRRARRKENYGQALAMLHEYMKDRSTERWLVDKKIRILKKLKWNEWVRHEEQLNRLRFLDRFPLF